MNKSIPNDVFKPKPTRTESKDDTTSKAAKAIISDELAQRRAKTERLRKARLAQEAVAVPDKPMAPKARAKKAAKS